MVPLEWGSEPSGVPTSPGAVPARHPLGSVRPGPRCGSRPAVALPGAGAREAGAVSGRPESVPAPGEPGGLCSPQGARRRYLPEREAAFIRSGCAELLRRGLPSARSPGPLTAPRHGRGLRPRRGAGRWRRLLPPVRPRGAASPRGADSLRPAGPEARAAPFQLEIPAWRGSGAPRWPRSVRAKPGRAGKSLLAPRCCPVGRQNGADRAARGRPCLLQAARRCGLRRAGAREKRGPRPSGAAGGGWGRGDRGGQGVGAPVGPPGAGSRPPGRVLRPQTQCGALPPEPSPPPQGPPG